MKMKTVEMERHKLGKHGPLVSKFGLGGVAMSDLYGHDHNDEESRASRRCAERPLCTRSRFADRVLAVLSRHRGRDPSDRPRAREARSAKLNNKSSKE
jgi:hypothetical protein